MRARHARLERFTDRCIQSGRASRLMRQEITISVVVHVVFKSPAENISAAQVRSQITALNRDYQAKNRGVAGVPNVWKGLAASPKLRFVLATRDARGNPTHGITRTKTTRDNFGTGDSVKTSADGVAPWPTRQYLNLWVCTLAGGLLGYAQFPGGPTATDGVVILNTAFGTVGTAATPFDLGRTATHEVGHWLNLRHIWGDRDDCGGTDSVSDTPNAQHPNYGTPTFPHPSCHNAPDGDMFMNYMDYVDDRAMVMFTTGQAARMNATFAGPRSSFLATPTGRAR